MFDIGFSEMMVIAIVALVVIGPERLPKVARAAGHMLGRLQRYVSDVKSDINREMQLEELRKLQSEIQESARSIEQSLTTEIQATRQGLEQTAEAARSDLKSPVTLPQPAEVSAQAAASGALPPTVTSTPVTLTDPGKPGRAA
jgi:sec-independent protein translocase protein TatB